MLVNTDKLYTQAGIIRLSKVIQATLRYNRWSEREFARQARISHNSANRYANAKIQEPQDHILQSIAPHIYVAKKISPTGVEIDTTRTYGENWLQLEDIVLFDSLSSSDSGETGMEKLRKLIADYIRTEKIDEEEFAKRALLHPVVIRSIFQGVLLGEPEVILSLLGSILKNPSTQRTFLSWIELAEYCSFEIKNKNSAPEAEQNHTT